jgi:prolyl-tRNA editing enzyme YbaK/EbsC (Cys-tRNA(Pro) deacylase)
LTTHAPNRGSPGRATSPASTGFSIGGIPPLGHDIELPTTIDESLRRVSVVWAAAGTPHDVFAVGTEALIRAIPSATLTVVS